MKYVSDAIMVFGDSHKSVKNTVLLRNPKLDRRLEHMFIERLDDLKVTSAVESMKLEVTQNDHDLEIAWGWILTPMERAHRLRKDGLGKIERLLTKSKVPDQSRTKLKRKKAEI